jgi:hypothetical protein
MWNLLPEAGGRAKAENARLAKTMLEGLAALVPEIRSLSVGVNLPEIAGNHDLVLDCRFDDLAALQRYQDHPEHRKVAEFVAGIRASRAAIDCQE